MVIKVLRRFVNILPLGLLLIFMFLIGIFPTNHAQAQEEILYEEDFNDGQAQDWEFDEFWGVEDGMLRGHDHAWAVYSPGNWHDFRLHFRLLIERGSVIHLNYRFQRPEEGNGRYYISFSEEGAILMKQFWQPEQFIGPLAASDTPHEVGRWHEVEINSDGPRIQFFVNNVLEFEYTDQEDPFLHGTIAFETIEESIAAVDNIVITGTPSGTIMPYILAGGVIVILGGATLIYRHRQTRKISLGEDWQQIAKEEEVIPEPDKKPEVPIQPEVIPEPDKKPEIPIKSEVIPELPVEVPEIPDDYPPHVERVAIVQWDPNATPTGFALFTDNKRPCLRYDAEWVISKDAKGQAIERILMHKIPVQSRVISPNQPAYIFLLFGPSKINSVQEGRVISETTLNVISKLRNIDIPIELTLTRDKDGKPYYWGSFDPTNCINDSYLLTLLIQGIDKADKSAQSQSLELEIDANPATIAHMDSNLPTPSWNGYEPGPDEGHKIHIAQFEGTLDINPASLILHSHQEEVPEIILKFQQKTWDCELEFAWTVTTCPVHWNLTSQVTKLDTPSHTISWEDQMKFLVDPQQSGIAKLVVNPNWQDYTPGRYEITIHYTVGEMPGEPVLSGIAKILIELE